MNKEGIKKSITKISFLIVFFSTELIQLKHLKKYFVSNWINKILRADSTHDIQPLIMDV